MAFIQGSLTDPNPGPALYALMAPALTTAGFTLVDTVTISTRTHKVWKSAAANNAQGLDWYLDVGYTTTGAGTITLQPFEFFDPATDLGYRGCYAGSSSTVIDATTFSRYGATGSALETNWIGSTTYTAYPTSLTTAAFGYWISCTPERVAMLLGTEPTVVTFVGFYQPDTLYAEKAGAALYPLVAIKLAAGVAGGASTSAAATKAALTRVPPVTTLAASGWGVTLFVEALTSTEISSYPPAPTGPVTAYPLVAFPVEMLVSAFGAPTGSALNTHYGTLRDMALMCTSASAVRGDTVTIAGAQWVLTTGNSNQSYLFKAA